MDSKISSDVDKSLDAEKNILKPASPPGEILAEPWTWKRIPILVGFIVLGLGLVAMIITLPIVLRKHSHIIEDAIPDNKNDPTHPLLVLNNFPDPGLVEHNGTWYAFGTNPKKDDPTVYPHVQIAVSRDFKHWNLTGLDALPTLAPWERNRNHWAPDVIQRVS